MKDNGRSRVVGQVVLAVFGPLALAGPPPARAADAIPVAVSPRVELLAVIFRLAGAEEYNQPASQSPYADEVARYFEPFSDHAAVKLARQVRAARGVGYDAVMSFAVDLRADALEPKIPFNSRPAPLDGRWTAGDARRFLEALRRFSADSKADAFFAEHRGYYERVAGRLAAELAKRPYRAWLDSFFGARPRAKFTAVVGLLNGGGNYGMAVRYPDGREEIEPIIGAARFDSDGLPVFGAGTAGLIVHEFCHSYTNPLVDQFAKQLLPAAEKIFPRREALLRQQAYGTPRTLLYESLVRACTVRYARDNDPPEEAARQLAQEEGRGFLWTGDLVELLGKYERHRDRYPTLEAFMPDVVGFFEKTAASIDPLMAKLPKVVSMTPENGAKDVDPDTSEIKIQFDKPMREGSYSLVGDPATTPAAARTRDGPVRGWLSADGKTFTLPVRLEAGKKYSFSLNSIYYSNFRSKEGMPLDPVKVTFTTAGR